MLICPTVSCGIWFFRWQQQQQLQQHVNLLRPCCLCQEIPASASTPASLSRAAWTQSHLRGICKCIWGGRKVGGGKMVQVWKPFVQFPYATGAKCDPLRSISVFRCRRSQLPSTGRDGIDGDRKLNVHSKHAVIYEFIFRNKEKPQQSTARLPSPRKWSQSPSTTTTWDLVKRKLKLPVVFLSFVRYKPVCRCVFYFILLPLVY